MLTHRSQAGSPPACSSRWTAIEPGSRPRAALASSSSSSSTAWRTSRLEGRPKARVGSDPRRRPRRPSWAVTVRHARPWPRRRLGKSLARRHPPQTLRAPLAWGQVSRNASGPAPAGGPGGPSWSSIGGRAGYGSDAPGSRTASACCRPARRRRASSASGDRAGAGAGSRTSRSSPRLERGVGPGVAGRTASPAARAPRTSGRPGPGRSRAWRSRGQAGLAWSSSCLAGGRAGRRPGPGRPG
jgi:hypothetical protein